MSLLTDDLKAIKALFDGTLDQKIPVYLKTHVPPLVKQTVKPMLEDLEGRINGAFDDMQKQINKLDAKVTDLDIKVTDLDAKVTDLDAKLSDTQSTVMTIQTTVARVEKNQAREMARLDEHEALVAKLRNSFNAI